jgi:hypothetical protein
MKVVRVIGGLGNQMFQYAFYLALKKKYANVKLDIGDFGYYKLHNYQLEKVFDLKEIKHSFNFNSLWMRIIRKGIKIDVIKEDPLYHPEVLELSGWVYYSGYWISEEYFKEVENEVREAFKFKGKLVDKNKDVAERIYNCNSVSIHIRRGDYLETNINRKIYGDICTLNYYEKAVEMINQKVENPSFFIFSNDIDWCKENLKVINAEYIDWNTGEDSYRDMQLMSLCKSNILANSTFSWWGGWLNENKEKNVVVPSRFFNDILPSNMDTLVPKDWIKIDVDN